MRKGPRYIEAAGMRARRCAVAGLAAVAAAGAAACGSTTSAGTSPAPSGCAGVAGAHHAEVVVEHANGATAVRCVGFSGATIAGLALMKDTHLEMATKQFSFGDAVCQLDSEPAHYDPSCPAGDSYWSAFVWKGAAWTSSDVGVDGIVLSDHEALGWRYVSSTANPAPAPDRLPRF